MSAEDYGWPGPMVLDLTDGMPTPPRRAVVLPRRVMKAKQARALNHIGLGCTAEPRRAR